METKQPSDSEALFGFFGLFYLLPSLICFLCGLTEANIAFDDYGCRSKMSKIEYVYPAYRLGCYLNKSP